MADQLDAFPQAAHVRYPWDEWTNGAVWKVRQGVDFDIDPERFRSVLYVAAQRRGMKAQTTITEQEVCFRFFDLQEGGST